MLFYSKEAAPGALSYGGTTQRYAIGLILELVMP